VGGRVQSGAGVARLTLLDLAHPVRSARRDRGLGATLAFVAGTTNAGSYLAVGQYTSHMTGIVSSLADNMVLRHWGLALTAIGALLAFVTGAMTTAISVNWARRRRLRSLFAIPLLCEAALLLAFGFLGRLLAGYTALLTPVTVLLLCFLMGLQNAVITKVSRAEIRTTHVTGLVTDIGIELGRLLYINRDPRSEPVRADKTRLSVHLLLFVSFLGGGLTGALGFSTIGYLTTVPLAGLLALIAVKPVIADLQNVRGFEHLR